MWAIGGTKRYKESDKMAEKNILMQRKNVDGTFDVYYPKTKVGNLVEGASGILDALKTVDGAGSGLDADFLRGETPQSFNQVAGRYNYVGGDSISAGGEREILIPIGESGKTHGNIMFIGEGRYANWYINTSPTGAAGLSFSPSNYQAGVRADYWDGNYTERQWAPREGLETIFGGTESDRHNWANIKYCYISGSNIVIRLKNTITSADITTDQATILWRVFG